jgi:hypothetical protein
MSAYALMRGAHAVQQLSALYRNTKPYAIPVGSGDI